MDKDESTKILRCAQLCFSTLHSHTHSHQTLWSCQVVAHAAESPMSLLKKISVNGEGSVQTQRCQQWRGDLAGSVSICHRVNEPQWVPPSTPFVHRSSHLSDFLNGHWEVLTTIWLAPLQRTRWPAWKARTHTHTRTQRTPPAFIRGMYERETGNDKLSQVDWLGAICLIWSGVVDIETLRRLGELVQKLSKTLILLAVGLGKLCINFRSCCLLQRSICHVFFVFFTSCQLQHIASHQPQHTPRNSLCL